MESLGHVDCRDRGLILAWRRWQLGLAVSGVVLGLALTNGDIKTGAGAKDGVMTRIARDDQGVPVWSLAFAGANHLASSTITGEARLMDLTTGRLLQFREGRGDFALSLAFSPGGRTLAVAGGGPAVRFWDAETGIELEPLKVGTGAVRSVAFAPDGATLAVSTWTYESLRSTVTVWEWPGRRRLAALDNHRGIVNALAFSQDGSRLITADSKGEVTLWDVTAGDERARRRAHPSGILAMASSPDGRLLATTCYIDEAVRLWDASSGEPRGELPITSTVATALAFSPDGTILAMARGDGSASLWDVASGREAGAVSVPSGSLQAVTFSGDGRVLATGEMDGSVRLWDVARVLDGKPHGP